MDQKVRSLANIQMNVCPLEPQKKTAIINIQKILYYIQRRKLTQNVNMNFQYTGQLGLKKGAPSVYFHMFKITCLLLNWKRVAKIYKINY